MNAESDPHEPVSIGESLWSRDGIVDAVDEFLSLYEHRPIQHNDGGMRTPHMFALWYTCKILQPSVIIESGVWRGQGTWIL